METKLLQRSLITTMALASAACLLSAAEASAAQPATAESRVTVAYRDLNLATIEGASALYRRIRGAARTVCGAEGRSLLEQSQWSACINEATAHAVAAVNNPLLTSIHNRTSHGYNVTAMLMP